MIILTFLLIAYLIRKKYLPEDATTWDKILYYAFSVVLTPLLGPWFLKKLTAASNKNREKNKSEEYGCTFPDFMN